MPRPVVITALGAEEQAKMLDLLVGVLRSISCVTFDYKLAQAEYSQDKVTCRIVFRSNYEIKIYRCS